MNRYAQRVAELTNPDVTEINERRIKPLTDAELQDIEHEMGQPLLPDYREFLRAYGGIWFGSNQCFRAALYHLGDYHFGRASINFCYDGFEMLREWKQSQEYKSIPPELISIGEDGNVRLFLAITGEHTGSVYQWYPSYFPENLYYYPELELIARSFDSFLQMLRPLEEGFYEKPEHYEREKQEIGKVIEKLLLIGPHAGNAYTETMSALHSRYVYATLGEDAKHLSEAELAGLEQDFGHSLPKDYREFLRDFGGYSFIPFPRHDGVYSLTAAYPYKYPAHSPRTIGVGHYEGITFFHGHVGNDYHDLLGHYQRLKGYLPANVLPIADAGQLCLKLSGEHAGAVYKVEANVAEFSLCPSYGGPSTPLQEESLTRVAASFDEFIRSLRVGIRGQII